MPKLTISAPFFNRSENNLFKAFNEIAKSNADYVLLRDVACQKREPSLEFYKKTIKLLHDNGKKVILNTPLIIRERDKPFNCFAHLVDKIEVNNIGYLSLLKNKNIILGPYLRIYNQNDLEIFKHCEFDRFVVPFGLTKKQIEGLLKEIKYRGEIFVFGLESVAISWDCFLASFKRKNRVNCQKECFKHPNGLNISSLNNIPLFKATGVEVLSQKPYSILDQIGYLKKKGVNYFRINPHLVFEISELRQRINDLKEIVEGKKSHEEFWTIEKCNGTFYEMIPGYEYIGGKDYK